MVQKIVKIFEELKERIKDEKGNREKYVNDIVSFTRQRKLTIEILVMFLLYMPKKTMTVELEKYFEILGMASCTKGSYSQRRKLLSHKIFIDMNEKYCNSIYEKLDCKRWKGKKVIAVDGTKLNLFNKKEVVAEFGVQKTKGKDVPMAHVISSYDVLNNICIKSEITGLNRGEGIVALKRVPSYSHDTVVLYDRGFPSFGLIFQQIENKIPFVMRLKKDFNKETIKFANGKAKEKIVEIGISARGRRVLKEEGYEVNKDTKIKVRLIRIELRNDFTIIATSLKNRKKYKREDFKKLYNLRWGIETYYDKLKNKMKAETFSGRTVENIKQEFYALILFSNIHSLIVKATESETAKTKDVNKKEQKINQNVTIGLLKDKIVELLISPTIIDVLLLMIKKFSRYKIPIIPDRQNKRKAKGYIIRGKHKTILNYCSSI